MRLNNPQDVDNTLRTIGRLQRDIQSEKILLDDAIENLKKMLLWRVSPLCEKRDAAEATLLEYIKRNKQAIASGPAKSIAFSFGTIGLRDSQSVPKNARGVTNKEIAEGLIEAGFKDCAKVEYRWIKNAVKALDVSLRRKLERIGIVFTKVKKDQPFYTINEAKIEEEKQ
jgi:phage host-nuclease inhibitor protein Gam